MYVTSEGDIEKVKTILEMEVCSVYGSGCLRFEYAGQCKACTELNES